MSKKQYMTMFLSVCFVCGAQAQSLKQQGTGVDNIVPQGWSHEEVTGDLNKDGIADLAVMAKPNFKENIVTREDGYEYNFNQPVFAIYFGKADGTFTLYKQYDELLPRDEDEMCSHDISLDINNRGGLNISTQLWCSMGSYSTTTNRYTFRFQDGDFYLIGMEDETLQRNTGEVVVNSENYLTWKRQIKKSNFTNNKPPKEKWSRLSKKPLEKMGARQLGDE